MIVEWALSIVLPNFKRRDDIINCSCYGAMELLERGTKVVKMVLKKASLNSDC